MRIVLDLQGAQQELTSSQSGGAVWRQALALAEANSRHSLFAVLSDAHPSTIDAIRAGLAPFLPQENILVWHFAAPSPRAEGAQAWRRNAAARIQGALISRLSPDVVYIPDFEHGNRAGRISAISEKGRTVVGFQSWDPRRLFATGPYFADDPGSPLMQAAAACGVLVFSPLGIADVTSPSGIRPERVRAVSLWPEPTRAQSLATARQVLGCLEEFAAYPPAVRRPRLAFVSPLPPERSGIADYSAELLRALAPHYSIDLIVAQAEISEAVDVSRFGVHPPGWLLEHAASYDRVLYHIGNSSYHQHMFDLITCVPGVVVLHDFFLADLQYFLEGRTQMSAGLARALYHSHGYQAVADRFQELRIADVVRKFPANLGVIEAARGVIVHSQHACDLARQWYGARYGHDWAVVPLLRSIDGRKDRAAARDRLGFGQDDFIVCCFGLLGPTKLNHRLLDVWLGSRLAHDEGSVLVFVGEEEPGDYTSELRRTVSALAPGVRVRFCGWVEKDTFESYLEAADVAVQLRTHSRGETSAAVLDCLGYGLPTIVNANGSFVELPSDCVVRLPDQFSDEALALALLDLAQDQNKREELGRRARALVQSLHRPESCAALYIEAMDRFYEGAPGGSSQLIDAIVRDLPVQVGTDERTALAEGIARATHRRAPSRQLFVDVSATSRNDLRTGIQRAVRALVLELVHAPPPGYRIEPVFLTDEGGVWHYRYARQWTSRVLGVETGWHGDEPIEAHEGDEMLIADLTMGFAVLAESHRVFSRLRTDGVRLHFVVYDLLPMQRPDFFPPGQFGFMEWLSTLSRVADSAICISQTTAAALTQWLDQAQPSLSRPIRVDWFHLGADLRNSAPTRGLPEGFEGTLAKVEARPSLLMVGTIEPRKGYLQVIEAFTLLWQEGFDVNLVVVGSEGWRGLPDEDRRSIPETMRRLREHSASESRLIFLEGASDEFLDRIYPLSTCLLAASEGEGFGLPLVEAARHGLPILARNLPIFREVAGDHAAYFSADTPRQLADALEAWLLSRPQGPAAGAGAAARARPWLTWQESAAMLIDRLCLAPP